MAFKPVGSLIGSLARRSKTPEAILALQVRQVAKQVIERELFDLPGDLVSKIKIKSFKNGYLLVNAPPLVATELQMRSERLKEAINAAVGRSLIRSLRIKVG